MTEEVPSMLLDDSLSWDGRFYELKGWGGVCDHCGAETRYDEVIPCVRFPAGDTPEMELLFPLIGLVCPVCRNPKRILRRWRSMDITAELDGLKK